MHHHEDTAAQSSWLECLWPPNPALLLIVPQQLSSQFLIHPQTKLHALSWLLPWRVTLPPGLPCLFFLKSLTRSIPTIFLCSLICSIFFNSFSEIYRALKVLKFCFYRDSGIQDTVIDSTLKIVVIRQFFRMIFLVCR